jgi:CCR4-NOT transcription complex subunit 1
MNKVRLNSVLDTQTTNSPSHVRLSNRSSGSDGFSNSNIRTIDKAQIVFLLSTLTEDNFERNQSENRSVSLVLSLTVLSLFNPTHLYQTTFADQLSEQHGVDTYLHFIRRLIVHSQTRLASTATQSSFDPSITLAFRLLVQETQRLTRDPFLADRLRDGIDKGDGDIFRHFDLLRFVDQIGLKPLERLVLASSFVATSTRKELANQAASIIRSEFDDAILALCQHPSFDHVDLSPRQVEKLLTILLSDTPSDNPILDASQRQALITAAA